MGTLRVTLGIVGITDHLKFVMREVSAPLATVYSQLFAPPHNTVRIFIVPDLNPVNHYVDWYRSNADGDELELLHTTEVDVALQEEMAFTPLEFLVGGINTGAPNYDPAADQDEYNNPDLVGLQYQVFRPGYGPLSWDNDIEELPGGGFKLLNGQIFGEGERYTLFIFKKTTFNGAGSGSKPLITDFVEITGNVTFDSSHYAKMLEANASVNLTVDIPSIASIPEGATFGINTHNGTQKYVTVQLSSGAYCLVGGVQRNAIYIGRDEEVLFFKKGTTLKVISWQGDFRRVGEFVKGSGIAPINSLATTGGWYLKTSYPRLFNWFINALPIGELGTGTDDVTPSDANKTKWIIGATKFWVPDSRDYFERVAPVGVNAGVNAPGQVGNHKHFTITNEQLNSDNEPTNDKQIAYQRNNGGDYKYKIGASNNAAIFGLTSDPTSGSGIENYPKYRTTNEYVII